MRGAPHLRAAASAIALLFLVASSVVVAMTVGVSDLEEMKADYRRPSEVPAPPDNAPTSERAALGKTLFFDPRLSGSGAISCASCHNPSLGWADGLAIGLGHMGTRLARHTPGIENLAWGGPYFWDGRADTLEQQAKAPILAQAEMSMPAERAVETISSLAGYRAAFARAYPGEAITIDTIAKAIANYERTIVSGPAPFDRWIEGEQTAISESAKRGFVLFNTTADCATCHSGWRFTDDGFHDTGVKSPDRGRGKLMSGVPVLEYAFKTPTLRNVALSAPYMHDGSLKTLNDVIDFYDHGFVSRRSLSPHVKRLNLGKHEKADLIAFLNSLTSDSKPVVLPDLPQGNF